MKKTKLLWLFTALLLVFNVVIYTTHWGGDITLMYVSDLLPVVCSLVASICLFQAFKGFESWDFAKLSWLMILIGISLDFIAESMYSILEIAYHVDMNETFPTLADVFWCTAYIPLFIGLTMMFLGYKRSGFPMGNIMLYGILSGVLLILSVSVIYYLLIPILSDTETGTLAKVFYMFYPSGDIFLVIPAVILMYITSLFGAGTISKPWKYLTFGFICFTVADLLYSFLSWKDLYGNGNLIDVAWHLGYLLIGMAALHQRTLLNSFNVED